MLRKATLVAFAFAGLLLPRAAAAQAGDPLIASAKQQSDLIKGNILKSAEKMPEEHYSFKPTPEVRSYGQLLGHIANASFMICSRAAGTPSPSKTDIEKTVTAKADLIKALNEAFTYCDGVYAKMTPQAATETVKFFTGMTPKLGVLTFNTAHNFEHYGNIVTYLRMKNIVPPSSEGQ